MSQYEVEIFIEAEYCKRIEAESKDEAIKKAKEIMYEDINFNRFFRFNIEDTHAIYLCEDGV